MRRLERRRLGAVGLYFWVPPLEHVRHVEVVVGALADDVGDGAAVLLLEDDAARRVVHADLLDGPAAGLGLRSLSRGERDLTYDPLAVGVAAFVRAIRAGYARTELYRLLSDCLTATAWPDHEGRVGWSLGVLEPQRDSSGLVTVPVTTRVTGVTTTASIAISTTVGVVASGIWQSKPRHANRRIMYLD